MSAPYAQYVGNLDAVDVLRTSLDDYAHLMPRFTPAIWDQPWAPDKWTVRQIMVHVAQWEMIFGIRVLCAVAAPAYTVQPMDQDELMRVQGDLVDGPSAWAAFSGTRRMNLALAESLTKADRRRHISHPEKGQIDVEYLLVTLAGHSVHHYRQLAPLVARAS